MSLLELPLCFLAGNNTERQPHAGPASCHFHLPILYHHLDNSDCIATTWVCGGKFLLSDTQINIRQQRYIISLELAVIRRPEIWRPKQYSPRQPTNQKNEFVTVICLGYGESLQTQIFPILLSLYICMYLMFCPLLGHYTTYIVSYRRFETTYRPPPLGLNNSRITWLKLLGVA